MRRQLLFIALMSAWMTVGTAWAAAAPGSSLLKAKQEAEAKGFIFYTSFDEIVAQAKKEGKLRVLSGEDSSVIKATAEAFRKKYPFIDARPEGVEGTEVYLRMLSEMKAGLAKWDVNYLAPDYYPEYLPLQKKFDILGMAQHGVLNVPVKLVDPVNRHIVALQSNAQIVAYNKELIAGEKVPHSWEDFLKPEFKERKFATDIRPKVFASLVPAWGLEKTLDFAKKLGEQKPIWLRGDAQIITYLMSGQYPIAMGQNYKTYVRVQKKDVAGVLGLKIVEPLPVRLSETQGVLATAENPHAALLWLAFQAGPEGQKIRDDLDLAASIFSPGSAHEQLSRGKKVSLVAWEHYLRMADYEAQIVKALGFPRAEKK
ncbi:MAG TPA: extracellular solute-binding protein [Candidatus Acidoferrales bacterium]|nr:extracellular solute-binding protein [Candidatus Acidoferrales bacterium]